MNVRRSFLPIAGFTGVALLLIVAGHRADAKQPIRDGFFTFYPSAVGTTLDTVPSHPGHCGVCHYDFNGGGTRNLYGQAVENAGFNLNSDSGRSNAFWSVRFVDSDGDGYTNQVEITDTINYGNTPTFPGLTTANTNLVSNVSPADIRNYLTPAVGGDTTPPIVQLLSPNGGQTITANIATNISWNALDDSGIAAVNLYVSLDNGATYRPIALGLGDSGVFSWVPPNRPTAAARIKVEARDTFSNITNDTSDNVFAVVSPSFTNLHGVPTTLRDFDLPGTQPFEHGLDLEASTSCASCHGGYDPAVEPQHNWQGSMMAHASRDPLFLANMSIANQDAPESGDLCLRCHFGRGWLAGRSVPTDGSRMEPADEDGVSCALCHRMVDPVYAPGVSPTNDLAILAILTLAGTNYGNGMFVIDPTATRRGPFTNDIAPHGVLASAFHRSAAFCGTCHDVSNPAFQNDGAGNYNANALDTTATNFSAHFMAPVERTYSEWVNSHYNSASGVYAPEFAGNKPDGRVSTCQDCHMRDISGQGCPTEFVQADLASVEACFKVVDAAEARFGRLDALINVAGLSTRGTIEETTPELWDTLFAVNLRAPFFLGQRAAAVMKRHKIAGAIANIGSVAAHGGPPFLTAYSTTKGALAILTRTLANSLKWDRIRVNTLNIGWTNTPWEHVIQTRTHGRPENWLELAAKEQPFGRLIEADEVARALAFMVSDESGLMTGAVIDFDQTILGTTADNPGV